MHFHGVLQKGSLSMQSPTPDKPKAATQAVRVAVADGLTGHRSATSHRSDCGDRPLPPTTLKAVALALAFGNTQV